RVAQADLAAHRLGQRHALPEEPLVTLERQVADADGAVAADPGEDLDDVGVDDVLALRAGDRHAVVAVAHEMRVADAVDLDGRHRLAPPAGERDPLPPRAHAAGGGTEAPVEVARAVDGADDAVERDRLHAAVALADPAERLDDLVEREDGADVLGLAAQHAADARQHGAAAGAQEVVLRVGLRESGVARAWHATHDGGWRRAVQV